jgi:hypothetical protein
MPVTPPAMLKSINRLIVPSSTRPPSVNGVTIAVKTPLNIFFASF